MSIYNSDFDEYLKRKILSSSCFFAMFQLVHSVTFYEYKDNTGNGTIGPVAKDSEVSLKNDKDEITIYTDSHPNYVKIHIQLQAPIVIEPKTRLS